MKIITLGFALLASAAIASGNQIADSQQNWVKHYAKQKKMVSPEDALINTDSEPSLSDGFVSLYNGKNLDGWTARGGQCTFEAAGDSIIGTCVPGSPSTYLSTNRDDYTDFIFTAEIKWEIDGNTGVMFRAAHRKGKSGREIVYGPQCEMEGFEKDRGWSGGIYGQDAGGWLYPLWLDTHEAARKALKKDGWNRVTIQAIGKDVKTWVNGVPTAHWIDEEYGKGFFSLQVHSGKQGKIHFRNLKVKELKSDTINTLDNSTSIAGEWIELFNGKDLTNWENPYDWGLAKVVDGELHLTTEKSKWFLSTEKEYSDFIFEAEVKMPEGKCNSGFLFRSHKSKNKMFGYQAEVDPSSRNWSGGLYDEGRRRWFISPNRDHAESEEAKKKSITAFLERAGDSFKRDDWNHYRIECRGDHIKISVNGVTTTDIHDKEDAKGYIALQHHGEKGQTYRFRNIKIMELTDEYQDLFAAGDFSKWTSVNGAPVEGWTIENGVIERPALKEGDKRPGSIITTQHYKNFDIKFDWKISEGGNSGVKYRTIGNLGLEYQVLDDGVHKDSNLSAGIYALVPATTDKPYNPGGQWNSGRIIAQGDHVEHWINGVKVAEIEIGSEDWVERFEKSKYKEHEGFGTWTGPIYLQDHNDPVSFRNVRIKEL